MPQIFLKYHFPFKRFCLIHFCIYLRKKSSYKKQVIPTVGGGRTLKVKHLTLNPRVKLLCFVEMKVGNEGKCLSVVCGGGLQLCLEDEL